MKSMLINVVGKDALQVTIVDNNGSENRVMMVSADSQSLTGNIYNGVITSIEPARQI